MKKYFVIVAFFALLIPTGTIAFCPVCTAAVAAGVGLSRYFKVDDIITGTWIGAFMISITFWMFNWLKTRKINQTFTLFLSALAVYFITILPLYYAGIVGHPKNTLFGVDRLLVGMIAGSILFMLALWNYSIMKKRNQNHAYFPFQKIAMVVAYLAIISFVFYGLIQINLIK